MKIRNGYLVRYPFFCTANIRNGINITATILQQNSNTAEVN